MLQDDHPIISIIIGIRCERNLEEFQPHKLVKDKNFVAMTIVTLNSILLAKYSNCLSGAPRQYMFLHA